MGIITGAFRIMLLNSWSKYVWTIFAVVSWIDVYLFYSWENPEGMAFYILFGFLSSSLAVSMWYKSLKDREIR